MHGRVKLKKSHRVGERPPFECVALVLQGGGALGAYQAGVYQALSEAEVPLDWIAGISIGAINSAIIAGNPPERRVERLREFWETVTSDYRFDWAQANWPQLFEGDFPNAAFTKFGSLMSALRGQPGFFTPRVPLPWLQPLGSLAATSYYDTTDLRATLERLVDFDRINKEHEKLRFSVGAVNVLSGNFIYFDNTTHTIRPEHVIASGSLPPGFAATEIDGQYYWDGGLVSNTPLQWVLDTEPRLDTLAFQIDLWSARGEFPTDLEEVEERQKEIRYSSRTRMTTDYMKRLQRARRALATLLKKLPKNLQDDPEVEVLRPLADSKVCNIVHLIYRSRAYENDAKDYDFSRSSMLGHWQAGYNDAVRTLRHPQIFERPPVLEGIHTFDLTRDGDD